MFYNLKQSFTLVVVWSWGGPCQTYMCWYACDAYMVRKPHKISQMNPIYMWCWVNCFLQSSRIWECDTKMRDDTIENANTNTNTNTTQTQTWSNIRYSIKKSDELWLVEMIRMMIQRGWCYDRFTEIRDLGETSMILSEIKELFIC